MGLGVNMTHQSLLDVESQTGDGQRWKVKATFGDTIVARLAHLEREAEHYLELICVSRADLTRYLAAA